MLHSLTPTDCARAREAASARADGELSELESGALDAHLHGCPACRDFARSAAGLAVRLRGAELEQPGLPIFVPRRRRPAVRPSMAAAAVALVAAAGSSFLAGHLVGSQAARPSATVGGSLAGSHQRSEVLGMLRRNRPGRLAPIDVIAV